MRSEARLRLLSRSVEGNARAIEYLKGRGLTGKNRGELRNRLRSRWLQNLESVFPSYATKR